jgi:flavin-dependent dehydrogenase
MPRQASGSDHEAWDVAVIGAGIAGLAACIYLRRAGLRVVCLDREAYPHNKVGESLDWSSPWLLGNVGLSGDALLADHVATRKAKIVVYEHGKDAWEATPPPAIRRSPLRFETLTLHVDRASLDQRVYEQALTLGAEFIWERVAHVDADGDRVQSCMTSSGRRVEARWYVDASGTARVLARAMHVPIVEYGVRKVCLWTYFDTAPLDTGTTFFLDNTDAYLQWIWDIPISPQQTSVGLVLPADALQARRQDRRSIRAILSEELARYPRFALLLASQPGFDVRSTSFRASVTTTVCGPNWMMVGEAASMPDPLTGNGLTSGIRHARYAAAAIARAGGRQELHARDRRTYSSHVHRLGHAFNTHIENAIYRHSLRRCFGMRRATIVYTLFAFFMNALYTRFDPRGPLAMALFGGLFGIARVWVAGWVAAARAFLWLRRPAPGEA